VSGKRVGPAQARARGEPSIACRQARYKKFAGVPDG
jgi:hypothetical protein